MPLLERIIRPRAFVKKYDITIFQTPHYGQSKGYKQVYRTTQEGNTHSAVLNEVFRRFNVPDLMPDNYQARYISTGDIVFIDEGRRGHFYYKLISGGWQRVNRVLIR
ncbi:hypothetical protein JOC86_000761 [Bacillus pakistanensis]|uniref:YodL-like protein n=1 Tax=Rossellomorea pakistanensis TaxID=992288 RepID=A0ABS2N8Y6_9BACI|nr:YodL domain-containing protein [Bacillus pakistanensis]MBM7584224.1 hypothetical protein [Bacillus pakistanensis]